MKNNNYVVRIISNSFGIEITSYIKKIVSYKKGLDGLKLTININDAHKYCNEKNASKPSQLYSGSILIV